MGDTLRSRGLQRETLSRSIPTPLSLPSASQLQPQRVSPYATDRISQPIHTTNDLVTLSQETLLKIQELKRLMYFRNIVPRFTPEARKASLALVDLLRKVAERKKATPAQIALAWLLV
jgi:diketogulonate reductase-like aldo/keto reductase